MSSALWRLDRWATTLDGALLSTMRGYARTTRLGFYEERVVHTINGASFEASQRYYYHLKGSHRTIRFPDGRFFVGGDVGSAEWAYHPCGCDLYRVRFETLHCCEIEVIGPHKQYRTRTALQHID